MQIKAPHFARTGVTTFVERPGRFSGLANRNLLTEMLSLR